MTRAELRYLSSTDVLDVTLDQYQPDDPEDVCITVDAYIGTEGGGGEDIFEFTVCTVTSLAARVRNEGHLFAGNYLIVPRYDYGLVWQAISSLCRETVGATWQDVAVRLSYFGFWEFHGYDRGPSSDGAG